LVEAFSKMSPEAQRATVLFFGFLAVIGPVTTAVGALVTAIGWVVPALGAVLAFMGGPVAVALLALAAVITGVVLVWKNWDSIIAIVKAVYEGVKTWLVDRFMGVVNKIKGAVDSVIGIFSNLKDRLVGHSIVTDTATAIIAEYNRMRKGMTSLSEEAAKEVAKAFADIKSASVPLTAQQARVVEGFDKMGISAAVSAKALNVSAVAISDHLTTLKEFRDSMKELEGVKYDVALGAEAFMRFPSYVDPANDAAISFYNTMRSFEGLAPWDTVLSPELFLQFPQIVKPAMDDLVQTIRGTFKSAFQDLPNLLTQAFVGGGGVSGALKGLGAQISAGLFGEKGALAGAMKSAESGLSKFFGESVGGAFVKAIPVIGGMIGPACQLIYAGIKKLFGGPSKEELAGRDLVAAFEQQLSGMMTAAQKTEAGNEAWKRTVIVIRDAYLQVGMSEQEAMRAAEALWASSKGGAEESAAAIATIQAILDQVGEQAEETAAEVTEATDQEAAALTDMMAAHEARLTDLTKQQQDLLASIADEAEEEVMGVIEQETRAKLAAVEEAIAAENRQAQEKENAAQEAADATLEIAESLAERLGKMRITIPVDFAINQSTLSIPGASITGMAAGGIGRVTRPTLFLAGEGGSEDYAFSGGGSRFGGGGTIVIQAWDGASVDAWLRKGGARQLAEGLVPQIPTVVKRYGLARAR
ncbi:MAG TPA: hypothetical protein VM487_21625, partial [Phycisphaerae bacterium]|nr:hypothetical protein [Phycisphaerae bacterium]